jgi:cytochrome c553
MQPSTAQEQAAAPAPSTGADLERGHALAYTCLGCHAVEDYKNAYPAYRVPKLRGQHAEYIVQALQAYKSGERTHQTMHSQASSLSDQDMQDVAAWFAGQPLKPTQNAVSAPPASATACVACHGNDGVGIVPGYPTLSGQHADYLERALTDYKKGGRRNPIMATLAAQLTDAQIEELAGFYASQRPALQTPPRSNFSFSAQR